MINKVILLIALLLQGFIGSLNSQTIDDLMIIIDTTNGVNVGESRKVEIYESLKNDTDSTVRLYEILKREYKKNSDIFDIKIKNTDTQNFYEIAGYGVDFDPELLPGEGKRGIVIYSTYFCGHCKKLLEELKNYAAEIEENELEVYYIILDIDNLIKSNPITARDIHYSGEMKTSRNTITNKFIRKISIRGVPTVLLIDENRKVSNPVKGPNKNKIVKIKEFIELLNHQ